MLSLERQKSRRICFGRKEKGIGLEEKRRCLATSQRLKTRKAAGTSRHQARRKSPGSESFHNGARISRAPAAVHPPPTQHTINPVSLANLTP